MAIVGMMQHRKMESGGFLHLAAKIVQAIDSKLIPEATILITIVSMVPIIVLATRGHLISRHTKTILISLVDDLITILMYHIITMTGVSRDKIIKRAILSNILPLTGRIVHITKILTKMLDLVGEISQRQMIHMRVLRQVGRVCFKMPGMMTRGQALGMGTKVMEEITTVDQVTVMGENDGGNHNMTISGTGAERTAEVGGKTKGITKFHTEGRLPMIEITTKCRKSIIVMRSIADLVMVIVEKCPETNDILDMTGAIEIGDKLIKFEHLLFNKMQYFDLALNRSFGLNEEPCDLSQQHDGVK